MINSSEKSYRLTKLQKLFILIWLLLCIFGALNSTILPMLNGYPGFYIDWLPHLRSGHVMFNKMPTEVTTVWFRSSPDPGAWTHVSKLVPTPALGYKRARVTIDMYGEPKYIQAICAKMPKDELIDFAFRKYDLRQRQPLISEKIRGCVAGILEDE